MFKENRLVQPFVPGLHDHSTNFCKCPSGRHILGLRAMEITLTNSLLWGGISALWWYREIIILLKLPYVHILVCTRIRKLQLIFSSFFYSVSSRKGSQTEKTKTRAHTHTQMHTIQLLQGGKMEMCIFRDPDHDLALKNVFLSRQECSTQNGFCNLTWKNRGLHFFPLASMQMTILHHHECINLSKLLYCGVNEMLKAVWHFT